MFIEIWPTLICFLWLHWKWWDFSHVHMPCERLEPWKFFHVVREPSKSIVGNSREDADVDKRQGFVIICIESVRYFFRPWKWGVCLSIRSRNGFLVLIGKRKEPCSTSISSSSWVWLIAFLFLTFWGLTKRATFCSTFCLFKNYVSLELFFFLTVFSVLIKWSKWRK